MDRSRLCARPGCGAAAVATLTFHYMDRQVWMDNLDEEPDPTGYDLCVRHSERQGVPLGWVLDDRRTPIIPLRSSLAV